MNLARVGDASKEACAIRLTAAWKATGLSKTQFCKDAGVSLNSMLNAQSALNYPSREVMLYLYRSHRIDFNFIIHGDFHQLPGEVQDALYRALCENRDQKDD